MVLKSTVTPMLVELFREVERVGVLAERGEHLGADGDDFGFHKGSFSALSSQLSAFDVRLQAALALTYGGKPEKLDQLTTGKPTAES